MQKSELRHSVHLLDWLSSELSRRNNWVVKRFLEELYLALETLQLFDRHDHLNNRFLFLTAFSQLHKTSLLITTKSILNGFKRAGFVVFNNLLIIERLHEPLNSIIEFVERRGLVFFFCISCDSKNVDKASPVAFDLWLQQRTVEGNYSGSRHTHRNFVFTLQLNNWIFLHLSDHTHEIRVVLEAVSSYVLLLQ